MNLRIPEPEKKISLTPFENILENLFLSSEFSDFEINFNEKKFKSHICILQDWKFFEILKYSDIHEPEVEMPVETFR